MAKGGMPVGALSRRIFTAAFLSLLITAGTAAAFLTGSVSNAAPSGQTVAVGALSLLTGFLFAFAWFLQARVLTPLDVLRRCLAGAADGALAQPLSGLDRNDEIGGVVRACERLRQASLGANDHGLQGLKVLIERLSKDATRLEADLALLSSATGQARTSIEDASVRAAMASHAAIEAAEIVRDGAERMTLQAEASVAALSATLTTRSLSSAPAGFDAPDASPAGGFARDSEAEAVLAGLAGDLDALERFARDRKTIAAEAAATLTVALVEAIDRLNSVADRISAAADLGEKSAAA